MKSIGSLPFSPVEVEVTPHFDEFDLYNISDTFSLMAEALDQAEVVVFELCDRAYQASGQGRAKGGEELNRLRYSLSREANILLPLLRTHLGALKMTARGLVEGLDKAGGNRVVIVGEKREGKAE